MSLAELFVKGAGKCDNNPPNLGREVLDDFLLCYWAVRSISTFSFCCGFASSASKGHCWYRGRAQVYLAKQFAIFSATSGWLPGSQRENPD